MQPNPQIPAPPGRPYHFADPASAAFAFDARYSLCTRCGVVLPVPVEGGALICGSCQQPQAFNPREVRPVHQLAPHPVTPEAQRIQALRVQDGRPFLPPPGLQSLVVNGDIADWKVQEGFAAWQSSRQELAATGSFDAAERLLFLTMFLPQSGPEMTPIQKRAFHEAAVDVMTIARHRQLILGQMARLSARDGDVRSAEAWLSLCDPQPDEIDMDSTYRASRALIDTIQQRWQNVIHVLGSGPDDIPIADFMDTYCGVLRANAWEKMGRIDVAVQLLDKELSRGASTVEGMLKKFPICEQSYAQALAQHEQASAEKVAAVSGGNIGGVLMMVGVMQLLISAGLLISGALNFLGLVEVFGSSGDFESLAGPGLAGVITGVVGLGLGVAGFRARQRAARARHIRLHGIAALAQVTNCSQTGTRINGVPQWDIHLMVNLPGQAPYQASTRLVMTDAAIANMQGRTVKVRVDPKNPAEVVLQLQ